MLLAETCSLLGYEVTTVASGLEALKMMEQDHYQVAFIDMKMPGMNGLETLEKALSLNPQIKGIVMTGYGETFFLEVLERGAYGIVQKPFDLDEIKGLLERALTDECNTLNDKLG